MRFAIFALVFFAGFVAPMIGFLIARPPLDADGWAFLERQRPRVTIAGRGTATSFFIHGGLNFALARRPIGGWEPAPVKLYQLFNLPAYVAANLTFNTLQQRRAGTSKLHSDIATAVFVLVGSVQWLAAAALLSARRSTTPPRAA